MSGFDLDSGPGLLESLGLQKMDERERVNSQKSNEGLGMGVSPEGLPGEEIGVEIDEIGDLPISRVVVGEDKERLEDPRLLELTRTGTNKDWSLDSGRSTMPPSRNGSLETPSADSSTSGGQGQGYRGQGQTPSPRGEGHPMSFRQSVEAMSRRSRSSAAAVSPSNLSPSASYLSQSHPHSHSSHIPSSSSHPHSPLSHIPSTLSHSHHHPNLPTSLPLSPSLYSPSGSHPSSVASSSPRVHSHRHHHRHPQSSSGGDNLGSPVCNSCRKVMGGDHSFASDTPDSLSELSERSGMETTV